MSASTSTKLPNLSFDDLPFIDIESTAFDNVASAEAAVAAFRDEVGLARSQRGIEALSYAAASNVLRDTRFNLGLGARVATVGVDVESRAYKIFMSAIMNQPPANHSRLRRAVNPWFTPKNAERMRADVRSWIHEWLDEQADAEVLDFHNYVSRRLPATLFCKLLGAPVSDWMWIADIAQRVLVINQPRTAGHAAIFQEATVEAAEYVLGLLQFRRENPADDLLSFIAAAEAQGDLDEDEIISLVWAMLIGSTDTTNSQLNLNMQTLATHPDQWALLKDRPELIPNAVVELTRFSPNIWVMWRVPNEKLEYRGITLTPEDVIMPAIYAANFDPTLYADPRRLDVSRQINPILAFGSGIHSCLGRIFAIMEQEEVLRAILQRWSAFEIVEHNYSGVPYVVIPQGLTVRSRQSRHS